MSHEKIGPKEQQLRDMRSGKYQAPKPSKADLRSKIAKVKPMANKGGRRGR